MSMSTLAVRASVLVVVPYLVGCGAGGGPTGPAPTRTMTVYAGDNLRRSLKTCGPLWRNSNRSKATWARRPPDIPKVFRAPTRLPVS